jgi:peptidoglycan/LPS O-acetylase OafA/YrhL
MVFVFHYGGGTHGGRLLHLFNAVRLRGWMGVDLFFVLSGFLITGILYDTRLDAHYFHRFFARRALRIFPAFYLLALLLIALTPVLGYQWRSSHLWFLIYLGNLAGNIDLTLYKVAADHHPAGTLTLVHLWSICVEEQFYLLWPLVIWLVRDRLRLLWIAAALSLAALTLRTFLLMHPHVPAEYIVHTLPSRLDTLLVGAILALLLRGPHAEQIQQACRWIFITCTAAVVAIAILSPAQESPWMLSIGLTFVAIAAAGLIGASLRPDSTAFRIFHLRPLRIFGKYSYGFYLFHAIWTTGWVHLAAIVGMRLHSTVVGTTLVMAANALVTFLAAKLSYDFFEVRFLRFKRHFEYDSEVAHHQQPFVTK